MACFRSLKLAQAVLFLGTGLDLCQTSYMTLLCLCSGKILEETRKRV